MFADVRSDDEDEDEDEAEEAEAEAEEDAGGRDTNEKPKGLVNGKAVEGSAPRKEGESFADAVRVGAERKKEL